MTDGATKVTQIETSVMSSLIIQSGKHRGRVLVLSDKEVVIGRDDDCQLRLASSDVSRRHCALRPSPTGLLVRDLGSSNGTLVNDVAIQKETLLKPGDMLRVGPMLFQVAGSKQHPEPASSGPSATNEPDDATDDNIASWLTEDDSDFGEHSTGDTTIVTEKPLAAPPPPADVSEPASENPEKQQFSSIAEEASDIIQRHRDSKQTKE